MQSDKAFNPRSLTKEDGFLKSESGDFYTHMGRKYYHVPSDTFKERIKKDKNAVLVFSLLISFLALMYSKTFQAGGEKALFLYGGLLVAFLVYMAGRKFIIRHLDYVHRESRMEYCESCARRFSLSFLLVVMIVETFCGVCFLLIITKPAYKNYDYYRQKGAPVENAQPYNPPAPQEPSAEYLQWMKDNNITAGQLEVVAMDLKDYADNERAHSLFMEKDTLIFLLLSPILPLICFMTAAWAGFLAYIKAFRERS